VRTASLDIPDEAVADVADGATVLVGGFGLAGMPIAMIDALIRQGASDLTIVNNHAGNGDTGLAALFAKDGSPSWPSGSASTSRRSRSASRRAACSDD
jgi:3-oxoadipate CoA-transferase alpha subunit